jgi:RNA polymerase sigma-70 factor, ECF subfamily
MGDDGAKVEESEEPLQIRAKSGGASVAGRRRGARRIDRQALGQVHWHGSVCAGGEKGSCRSEVSPVFSFFSKPFSMAAIQSPVSEEIHPDVALVERARSGDVSAFEQLVRQYDRQIFRVAQHITQNREDAEDITQDAFLKAYQKLDQFQGNSKFSTWLVRIAVNESLMRLRKRKTSRTVSMDEDVQTEDGAIPRDFADWSPNPEQQFNQNELGDILRKTIKGLSPGFRSVFTLRDIENLSTEETAEALGLSVPAVKSRLLRARLQLRERLSRYFRQKKESTAS